MERWKSKMLSHLFQMNRKTLDYVNKGLFIKYSNIPKKLYKYQKFTEFSKQNLLESNIWFSLPENFNDPYDCYLTYSVIDIANYFFDLNMEKVFAKNLSSKYTPTKKEIRQISKAEDKYAIFFEIMSNKLPDSHPKFKKGISALYEGVMNTTKNQLEPFSNIVKKTIISCFSEVKDSIRMWSHYADYHRGFLLEYDFKSLSFTNLISKNLYPVIYQEKLIDITEYLKIIDKDKFNYSLGTHAAITKFEEWNYEREWRIVFPGGINEKEMAFPVPLPQAIYAGARISENNKLFLQEFATKNNIKLFQCVMNPDCFKIEFIEESD